MQLQRLLSAHYGHEIKVNNRGVGGIGARTCAALSNGQPMHFTVADGILPTSGSVELTSFDANPITDQNPAPIKGTYAGVRGVLSVFRTKPKFDQNSMIFTREQPGMPLPVTPMSAFYTDIGMTTRDHIKIMVYGRNGMRLDPILAAIDGDVSYQRCKRKCYLVGSVMTAVTEIGTDIQQRIAAINSALSIRYQDNYVDLDSPPTYEEMLSIGFIPDSYGPYSSGRTDQLDIAAGVLPSGMRMGGVSNNQHLNNYGYALWAMRFCERIVSKGWFDGRYG
ncbi:hypothetical protein [Novosphingobium sp. HR1a]|nr:hypothetical protein [Novosphingobium sp. HR1a]